MTSEIEEWRPVVAYEGRYEVSSLGRLRSVDRIEVLANSRWGKPVSRPKKGHVLALNKSRNHGYLSITLHNGEKPKEWLVHRLVCEAFHGPRPPLQDVAHLNGDGRDNRASHVRWASRKHNQQDVHIRSFARAVGLTLVDAFQLATALREGRLKPPF